MYSEEKANLSLSAPWRHIGESGPVYLHLYLGLAHFTRERSPGNYQAEGCVGHRVGNVLQEDRQIPSLSKNPTPIPPTRNQPLYRLYHLVPF